MIPPHNSQRGGTRDVSDDGRIFSSFDIRYSCRIYGADRPAIQLRMFPEAETVPTSLIAAFPIKNSSIPAASSSFSMCLRA
jgi:hypothetical protein